MKKIPIQLISIIVILSFLLAGLSSEVFADPGDTPTPTTAETATDTLVPTATDTLVPTTTDTLVPTATDTLVVPTATITLVGPTSTSTLVPTATLTLVPGPTATTGGTHAYSPSLGAAGYYSVLGGETVTNTGSSSMPGNLGVSPGSAVTGGPIVGPPGTIHAGDSDAAGAQIANSGAFDALDQGCDVTYPDTKDLSGLNLVAGVYCADAFRLTGTLTLSGTGVWIFKSASDLVASGAANVVGGDACNIWWREVSSATIGTGASFKGNILASTSISLLSGASLQGRALAYTGQVSLQSNTITGIECLTSALTSTSTPANPATATALAATATARAAAGGSVSGLPSSGGAPIQNENFPWALPIIVILSIIALIFGVRTYRRSSQRKQ